jgi:hypothetical protein
MAGAHEHPTAAQMRVLRHIVIALIISHMLTETWWAQTLRLVPPAILLVAIRSPSEFLEAQISPYGEGQGGLCRQQ